MGRAFGVVDKEKTRWIDIVDEVIAPLALLIMGCVLTYMFCLLFV